MSHLTENIKLIEQLRKRYHEGRIGTDIDQQIEEWKKIEAACSAERINTDLIIMSEDVFKEMTAQAIEAFNTYVKPNN